MTLELPADRLPCPWRDETQSVARLRAALNGCLDWSAVRQRCEPWIEAVRRHPGAPWALESLLHEFPLSSQEGVAMMRLAEALLRVPDADTALALTADQLNRSPQPSHGGEAAREDTGWLASLTQRALAVGRHLLPPADHSPSGWLQRLGAPTVVAATVRSMQLMGQQFVLGQTVDEALKKADDQTGRAAAKGQQLRFSLDMLGEGARTAHDAARYLEAYRSAMRKLADPSARSHAGPPIHSLSIKLSALHPRLEPLQAGTLLDELLPPLTALVRDAMASGVAITLDAEESWRLELQLLVLERLLTALSGTDAIDQRQPLLGLAVQAYQHRALEVIDEVARLARVHGRPLTVRLVKGAYWDTEIKRAQELGLPGFPVFTLKAHTDLSYLACARALLAHQAWLHPQFATHNAATVAAVMQLAARQGLRASQVEWQRLHGMGEALWREILADPDVARDGGPALRIYAPVGTHRDLLAYLVRRLLENGANTSFIHQLIDPALTLDTLLVSPLVSSPDPHTIRLPAGLYGQGRVNARGLDLNHQAHRHALGAAWAAASACEAKAMLPLRSGDASRLMHTLSQGAEPWGQRLLDERCAILACCAERLEHDIESWAADLVAEAFKTWPDAVAEVRETIDYARYYAQQAKEWLTPRPLPGPTGESNEWRLRPRGVWVCIAPWNFPLAIFGGQLMAALVSGNAVVAKPAPQTPRIAARLVALLHELGVPADALACAPGGAEVGEALVGHAACAGVAFTGSVATARRIQRLLADRADGPLVPLIAETGGINALIADSSALPEQLIDSVLVSAFGSAGQRCSALRLLCLHSAMAHEMEVLIAGALQTLMLGPASAWSTDVGPVIDDSARSRLMAHIDALARAAQDPDSGIRLIGQARGAAKPDASHWPFVTPCAYALPTVGHLREEHFGPVLHVVRWGPGTAAPSLDELIDQINASGYGLTLGVHTRIDTRAEHIARRVKVGNVYVNRSMTGAVVGAQPFGGQGLSGTGPKAGGPLYLPRFCTEQAVCINTAAAGGNAALMAGQG
jgi:RHH-type proline utilization regulon transcriptional repressor/proline dehydrogenase/delta 1-pyrroline-5-carboxylate dehydrogenase